MHLDVEFFGEGWYAYSDLNKFYDIAYGNAAVPEKIKELVMARIDIYESVDIAIEWTDRTRERFPGQNEYDLADEAFWATEDTAAYSIFRHQNARGQVLATRERSTVRGLETFPWQAKAVEVAEAMFDHWRQL